jgi:hypothetical protein
MALNAFRERSDDWLRKLFVPEMNQWVSLLFPISRRRPSTDDMMQMLDDLGIEPPERQPPRLDNLTFVWK